MITELDCKGDVLVFLKVQKDVYEFFVAKNEHKVMTVSMSTRYAAMKTHNFPTFPRVRKYSSGLFEAFPKSPLSKTPQHCISLLVVSDDKYQ